MLAGGEKFDNMEWMHWTRRPLFRNILQMEVHETSVNGLQRGAPATDAIDYKAAFAEHKDSLTDTARVVAQSRKRKLAATVWMPEEDIDVQRPMHVYGADSLVAVKLRYWLTKDLRCDLNIFEIMVDASIVALSLTIARKSAYYQSHDQEKGQGRAE